MMKIVLLISVFLDRLHSIISSVWGALTIMCMMVVNFIVDYRLAFVGVGISVLIDMIVGIWAAIRKGEYAQSELARDTISKILTYGGALVIIIYIEKLCGVDIHIGTNISAACICAVELWSIAGNALIINTNLSFFRLIRSALVGEIARKLRITEDDVKTAFENNQQLITNGKPRYRHTGRLDSQERENE